MVDDPSAPREPRWRRIARLRALGRRWAARARHPRPDDRVGELSFGAREAHRMARELEAGRDYESPQPQQQRET